jgi:CDP-diacylglycerol--glycerol-3-phosphate 3-phosphatidyltransferase
MKTSMKKMNLIKTPHLINISSFLTFSRIACVVPILFGITSDRLWVRVFTAVLFALASLTDFFDGWSARRYNQVSNWGKIFDPVADKVLVTSVLVALIPTGAIDPYMVIILLARDTLVGGLRNLAANQNLILDAKPTGKWKTALQMVAIPALIIGGDVGSFPLEKIGFWSLWFSVILSIVSGLEYAYFYRKASKTQEKL